MNGLVTPQKRLTMKNGIISLKFSMNILIVIIYKLIIIIRLKSILFSSFGWGIQLFSFLFDLLLKLFQSLLQSCNFLYFLFFSSKRSLSLNFKAFEHLWKSFFDLSKNQVIISKFWCIENSKEIWIYFCLNNIVINFCVCLR